MTTDRRAVQLPLGGEDCGESRGESRGESWEEHWVGMPEFVQHKKEPFSTIIIRVETEQDLIELAARLEQTLTPNTKSIWYPHKPHRLPSKQVWRSAK